jgi:hypothetical protein
MIIDDNKNDINDFFNIFIFKFCNLLQNHPLESLAMFRL